MEVKKFEKYNKHTFTGVTIADNGEFEIKPKTIRMNMWGRGATIILDPKVCTADENGRVHLTDDNGKPVTICVKKALNQAFGTEYKREHKAHRSTYTGIHEKMNAMRKPRKSPFANGRKGINQKNIVAQFSEGLLVGIYRSMKDCERLTGISREDVIKALNGEIESVNGYTFKIMERAELRQMRKEAKVSEAR